MGDRKNYNIQEHTIQQINITMRASVKLTRVFLAFCEVAQEGDHEEPGGPWGGNTHPLHLKYDFCRNY